MVRRKVRKKAPMARTMISFHPDAYSTLERIARNKKVSLAWVVRDAVDRYLAKEKV